MKLLFLDIDGVLNDHTRHENGVCGLKPECIRELNRILRNLPDLQLVISSAWRYHVHNGFMTHQGFDMMLQTHGVHCHGRIHGFTRKDSRAMDMAGRSVGSLTDAERAEWNDYGLKERAIQIRDYWCDAYGPMSAVVDDLPLDLSVSELFQTDGNIGLTTEVAKAIIVYFERLEFAYGKACEAVARSGNH